LAPGRKLPGSVPAPDVLVAGRADIGAPWFGEQPVDGALDTLSPS
jgi:hypothetical protein